MAYGGDGVAKGASAVLVLNVMLTLLF